MRLDLAANLPHYLDHMAPIWVRLPLEARGSVYVPEELTTRAVRAFGAEAEIRSYEDMKPAANLTLVAGHSDMANTVGRRHILMEHGCGQAYRDEAGNYGHPAYAGGVGRESVELFLCPNEYSAKLNRDQYPDTPAVVIGSPRLEQLLGLERTNDSNTIAFGFHFDLMLFPETRNAWAHFAPAVTDLAKNSDWNVLGHAHPRIYKDLAPTYRDMGVEPVAEFEEVIRRADVYVCDNSSTLFEFAAVVGPVVVMNPPWYRYDVNHGLRFWEAADVGPQVTDPLAVAPAAKQAKAGWAGKEAALDVVFPAVEDPAAVAAEAILKALYAPASKPPRPIPAFPRRSDWIHEGIQ